MFKSIVVPVDLAEMDVSKLAIDKAVALAAVTSAPLHFVYVPPAFDEEQHAECETKMAGLIASLPLSDKSRVTSEIRMGSVYNEVLAEVEKHKADLIVIGSHRPAMATYLLGSNATTIVRHAPCSVMVIRPEASKKVSASNAAFA